MEYPCGILRGGGRGCHPMPLLCARTPVPMNVCHTIRSIVRRPRYPCQQPYHDSPHPRPHVHLPLPPPLRHSPLSTLSSCTTHPNLDWLRTRQRARACADSVLPALPLRRLRSFMCHLAHLLHRHVHPRLALFATPPHLRLITTVIPQCY